MTTLELTNAAITEPITKPGVYDITNEQYQADPVKGGSLSNSGARRLLPPSCPALFRYEQDHGRPTKRDFEFGHAAHNLVLGAGPETVVIKADSYRTNAAKDAAAEARAEGKTPLLEAEYAVVLAMAAALKTHPIASALLSGQGKAEQSLFWIDPETGVCRRARPDWLPERPGGRLILPDYKTAKSAAPEDINKALHDYGYARQAAWYLDGVYD